MLSCHTKAHFVSFFRRPLICEASFLEKPMARSFLEKPSFNLKISGKPYDPHSFDFNPYHGMPMEHIGSIVRPEKKLGPAEMSGIKLCIYL